MKHFVCAAFALAIVFSLSAGSVSAHHSFAATYLEGQTQKIEGKVVQFLFRNPHSFLHVEAPDEKGTMQVWNIEWGGGGLLGRQGVNRDTLKPGDRVIVVGQPGRVPEEHRLRMMNLTRPTDGWKWGGTFD
ncbi:MAG: hypothetical protein AUG08_15765 [Acidobacteria bacterium 13_1_20CM_2_55_15]|nr:MAG: hypothetical protein AUH28_11345 [Acidobacteria bacterium 13_1_40CM_56_16]OLD22671.1 MAG: hypothetical protein AUI91_01300 [Acidobacteria bacterium 13_1_40CM_3_56_11]OLE86087.1 MAG: hypothetical protein AUG08_15765 [Acidobacteria bacterium 13_1_20CM_2_55_15]